MSSAQHHSPTTPTSTKSFPIRLAQSLLAILFLTGAFYLLPTLLHHIVTSLNTTHEFLGRRARSPYAPEISWTTLCVSIAALLLWHVWIARLSYKVVGGRVVDGSRRQKVKSDEGVVWGRILGRIVVPGLLVVLGGQFVWSVLRRAGDPGPLVKGNWNGSGEV